MGLLAEDGCKARHFGFNFLWYIFPRYDFILFIQSHGISINLLFIIIFWNLMQGRVVAEGKKISFLAVFNERSTILSRRIAQLLQPSFWWPEWFLWPPRSESLYNGQQALVRTACVNCPPYPPGSVESEKLGSERCWAYRRAMFS